MKFLAINPQISTDVLDWWLTFFCCQLQNAVKTKTFRLVQVLLLGDHHDLFKLRTLTLLLVATDSCNII